MKVFINICLFIAIFSIFLGCSTTEPQKTYDSRTSTPSVAPKNSLPDDPYKNIPRRPLTNENDFIDYCLNLLGKPLPYGYNRRNGDIYTRSMVNEIDDTQVTVVLEIKNSIVFSSAFGMNTEHYAIARSFCDFYRDYIVAKGYNYDASYYSANNDRRYFNNDYNIIILSPNISGAITNAGLLFTLNQTISNNANTIRVKDKDGFDKLFDRFFSLFGTKVTNYIEKAYNGSYKIEEFYADDVKLQFNLVAFLDSEQRINKLHIIINSRDVEDGIYLLQSIFNSATYNKMEKVRQGNTLIAKYLNYNIMIRFPEEPTKEPLLIFIEK